MNLYLGLWGLVWVRCLGAGAGMGSPGSCLGQWLRGPRSGVKGLALGFWGRMS